MPPAPTQLPFQPRSSPGPPPASPLQTSPRRGRLEPAPTVLGRLGERWAFWSAAVLRRISSRSGRHFRYSIRTSPGSPPKCFASVQDPADSASPRQCKPCPQPTLREWSRHFFVGAQSAAADPPNAQPNPPLPPSATPDVPESPGKPSPHTAQTGCWPPLRYENCNRYTSSGRTAPARKSRASSSPKNSSTPPPQSSPQGLVGRDLSSFPKWESAPR